MKAKRLVSFITATAFLLGSVAPGFAATTTSTTSTGTSATVTVGKDVKGTKYETPVAKLAALGVLNGKDSEGNVKPDDTITRAEFAKILVTELNMDSGLTSSTTKFKDVPSTHWASGYVALATGKGLIKGYPGGQFKPEAPVTYAEAATMVVRMLGYSPAVDEKAWPASYLSKAASIGVSDGVKVKANEAAKRGDIFLMASNALDTDLMDQEDYGTETIYRVQEGETLLSEDFNITVMDDKWAKKNDKVLPEVTNVPRIDLKSLEANEVEFNTVNGVHEVAPQLDPNAYLGEQVELWVDEDEDYVYYMQPTSEQEVINDTVDKVDAGKIYLNDKDDDYKIAADAKIWANINADETYGDLTDADLNLYTDANVKVILNKDDEVTGMVLTDYYPADGSTSENLTKSGLVKEVKTADESIEFFKEGGGTDSIDLEDQHYVVMKNGAAAKLEDIKQDDIINVMFNADEDQFYIVVTSTVVEGKVEKSVTTDSAKASSYDLTINGTKYDICKAPTWSEDANKSVKELKNTDAEDLEGTTVKAYLDANGDIRHISAGATDGTKNAKIAIVTKGALYNYFDDSVTIEAMSESGTSLKWTFDPAKVDLNGKESKGETVFEGRASWETQLDIDSNGAAAAGTYAPIVIQYDLDSAGNLSDVDLVYADKDNDGVNDYAADYPEYQANGAAVTVEEDDNAVSLEGSSYNVVTGSVFFDLANKDFTPGVYDGTVKTAAKLDDAKTASWDSIKSKNTLNKVIYKMDEDEVEYMFVLAVNADDSASLSSEGKYGIVKGWGKDYIDIINAENTVETLKTDSPGYDSYLSDGRDTLKKGDFIRYEQNASDEVDNIEILAYYNNLVNTTDVATDFGDLNLQVAKMVYVTGTSGTSVQGNLVADNGTIDRTAVKNYTVNDNTKFFEIDDTDKLKAKGSVSTHDLVLILDTDDDGYTADYVIVVKAKYND